MAIIKDNQPMFDNEYYMLLYPEYRKSTSLPLIHYVHEGWKKYYNPSPWFNTSFYVQNYMTERSYARSPLEYYEEVGRAAGHRTAPELKIGDSGESCEREFAEDIAFYLAYRAGLFNPQFYGERHGAAASANPLRHFREQGWRKQHNPSPLFDSAWYEREFMQGQPAGEPLLHAVFSSLNSISELYGLLDHRMEDSARAKGLFDSGFYLYVHPELAQMQLEPFLHYVFLGYKLGYDPAPIFNTKKYYMENQPHNGQNPILHCLAHDTDAASACFYPKARKEELPDYALAHIGAAIGYLCEREQLFDADYYIGQYEDVRINGVDPAQHFRTFGYCEGRNPSDKVDWQYYCDEYLNGDIHCIPLWHYLVTGKKHGFSLKASDKAQMLERENEELLKQLARVQKELLDMKNKTVVAANQPLMGRKSLRFRGR